MSTQPHDASSPSWRQKLRHAFAVDPPGAAEPTESQRLVVEKFLNAVVRRGMAQPAGIFLESWRPLGVLTGQGMQALAPFAGVVIDAAAWQQVADYLDRRGAIVWMLQRLDQLESQREASQDAGSQQSPPSSV